MSSLDQMNIGVEGIGHALADNKLAVPAYQRSYAWEETHVRELFQDIGTAIEQGEREYFLGSIVLTEGADGRLEVVDGQQRLATTTILLAAIRDYLATHGEDSRASRLESTYLSTHDIRSLELEPRLLLNQTDRDFFEKRILSMPDNNERQVTPAKEPHRKIDEAAQLAADHVAHIVSLSNQPVDRLLDWVEYIKGYSGGYSGDITLFNA